ncbi:MAG: spore germination protein [Tumebacillaceae bacterium]
MEKILDGSVMIAINEKTISISMKNFVFRDVSESTEENILQGPKDSLSENIETSLNLIRNRYKRKTLLAERHTVGNISNIKLIVLYDEHPAETTVVAHFKEKIQNIQVDLLQSAGQLQKCLIQNKFNLFPLFLTTERPDRNVKNFPSAPCQNEKRKP